MANTMNAKTIHAEKRTQQRCIPPLIIDWLYQFGAEQYDSRGVITRYFNKASKKQAMQKAGKPIVKALSRYMDSYLVEGNNGKIITVGYRYKRIKR